MEMNVILNPAQIGVLGLNTVVLAKNDLSHLLEEEARFWCGNIIAHKSPLSWLYKQ